MELPEGPIYCEICREKSMENTEKQTDVTNVPITFFKFPTLKIPNHLGTPTEIHFLCQGCGQLKTFLTFR